jgi:glycosyltransferase involved in cell wall biosynthesis
MPRRHVLPTLGVYGPGPCAHSGVTRYIKDSVPFLGEAFDVRWVHGDTLAPPDGFDFVLYHLGNNMLHHGAFRALRRRAGPSILHEFNTFGYYRQAWDDLDDEERWAVLSLLSLDFGKQITSLSEAEALARKLRDSPVRAWDVGVECLALRRARPAVVHSPMTSALLRARHPTAPVRHVPMPVTVPPPTGHREVRARLGIPQGNLVFGVLGFLSPVKRVGQIIETWNTIAERPASWSLLIAGERVGEVDIPACAGVFNAEGYWSDNEFDQLLDLVDCGIQLRDPSMGETSGVVASLIARGTPVIVNDPYGALAPAEHPLVIRISTGEVERYQLSAAMHGVAARVHTTAVTRGPGNWQEWTAAIVDILMSGC